MNGNVIAVFIAPCAEAAMRSVSEAQLEEGRGIIGDRYYVGTGTFSEKLKTRSDQEITLIESEQIDLFNRLTGLGLHYGAPRRNVVTAGIGLNDLVGVRFRVGEALLEGLRLCEPCAHLASLVAKEVVPEMVHRAGLRARIVSGGTIKPADKVNVVV